MPRAVCARAPSLLGCLLALCCIAAPTALAQGTPTNPFAPFPQTSTPTSATQPPLVNQPTTTNATTGSGSLSGGGVLAIAVGAVVVLGGISGFIWHDARRRAPVRSRATAAAAGPGGRPGSKQRDKPRKLSAAEKRRRKRGRAR
jgi:hypothetical protein